MKQNPDHYTILQVDPQADMDVIRAAYRRLAAQYHPDIDPSPDATEKMKLLNIAYSVLSNPQKRQEYDMSRIGQKWQKYNAPMGNSIPGLSLVRLAARIFPVIMLLGAAASKVGIRLVVVLGVILLVLWLVWRKRTTTR